MADPATDRALAALERGDAALVERLMRNPAIALGQNADIRTGAPAGVRAAVGAAPSADDRLATIRRTFPDARPYGDGNFVYTNPRTGRPTLYNPQGLDWGDLASIGPEIGEFLGGAMGGAAALPPAIVGAPATGGASFLAVPAGIGLGAAAGREIVGATARYVNGTQDSRGLPERVGDAALTAGMNAASVPVGAAIEQGVRRMAGPVTRMFGRGTGRAALSDFTEAGVPPSAGAVTGNRTTQLIERGLEATPGGAEPIRALAERQVAGMSDEAGRIAAGYGVASPPAVAASGLRRGAQQAAEAFRGVDGIGGRQSQLYDDAFNLVGANTPAQLPSVMALRQQIEQELARAPSARARVLQPVLDRIDTYIADAGDNGLPFQALREIRTDLGRVIGAPPTAAGAPPSDTITYLRALYGSLSDDMTAAARAVSPEADRALAVADRYTRFNRTQNMPVLDRMLQTSTDDNLYRLVFPASGRPDAQALARIRRQMPAEEWGNFSATVLERMGLPTAGQRAGEDFSVSTFLTNFNRLNENGPAAAQVLFGGSRNADLFRDLQRLSRVAGSLRDADRMANPSGTARNLITGGGMVAAGERAISGDLAGAAGIVALGTIAPRFAAQILTNPTTVRWLAGALPALENPTGQRAALARMATIAEVNPRLRDAVEAFRQTFNPAAPIRRQ